MIGKFCWLIIQSCSRTRRTLSVDCFGPDDAALRQGEDSLPCNHGVNGLTAILLHSVFTLQAFIHGMLLHIHTFMLCPLLHTLAGNMLDMSEI